MGGKKERSEIDDRYKWDISSVYESREDWEEDIAAAEQYIDELQQYEGRLLDDAETLHEAALLKEQVKRKVSTINFYAEAKKRTDSTVDEHHEMASQASSLSAKKSQAASFMRPELLEGDWETVQEYIDEIPGMSVYEKDLKKLFEWQEHSLSKAEEELVSELSDVLWNQSDIHDKAMNTDIEFPTVERPNGDEVTITHSNRSNVLEHPNREFRERGYKAYMDTATQLEYTMAENLENLIKTYERFADIRGFESHRQRKLGENDIPTEVYDNLLETVKDYQHLQERKSELLQNVLDVDEIQSWDGYMSLAGEKGPEIPYEDAVEHVLEALQPLGDDYVARAEDGLETWADVYPNEGKRSGAFSWGTYDTEPFLFLNHQNDIPSMYTLGHELGHSMHKLFSGENQPYQTSDYTIFAAETASTVNEALLTEHLLDTFDDETMRAQILDNAIGRIDSTIGTQAMFADFEHRAHEAVRNDEALTPGRLNDMYSTVVEEHRGQPPSTENEEKSWMRIPHFYRPYYVYQYATGMSAALSLSQQILDDSDPNAADRYRDFLASGGSDDPISLLQDAGVDMTTTEPVEDAMDRFETYLDEMEQLQNRL